MNLNKNKKLRKKKPIKPIYPKLLDIFNFLLKLEISIP